MRLLLLGKPGCGKGTQAAFLTTRYRVPKIAPGDMLRQAVASGTALGQNVKALMEAGQLVPDDIVINLILERIAAPDCAAGYLLDGFPRTLPQAEMMQKEHILLDHVIEIDVPDIEVIDRLTGRWVHPPSGRIYHATYHPSQVPGQDDVTGEPLVQRNDDREDTVRNRLRVYAEQTQPLSDYYQAIAVSTGQLTYFKVSGVGDVMQIRDAIFDHIDNTS